MPTKITVDALSEESLSKAADRVRKYQRALANKNRQFVKELAQKGIEEAATALLDDIYPLDTQDKHEAPTVNNPHVFAGKDGEMSATLKLSGPNAVFVEFGAGTHFNGPAGASPHPLGEQLGYTIGSYGQGKGQYDSWEYTKSGTTYTSFGTPALMPLWKASQKMRQEAIGTAKSIFSIKGI